MVQLSEYALCEAMLGEVKVGDPCPSLRNTTIYVENEHRLVVVMGYSSSKG